MKIRVYYEDTDCGGVVYHSNYLNFCERARSELFFERGLSPHKQNEFFVVKNIEANFIRSAVFGDTLDIKTSLVSIKKASLSMSQEIYRKDELIFKANIVVVFLKDGKPSKIPADILEIFEDMQ